MDIYQSRPTVHDLLLEYSPLLTVAKKTLLYLCTLFNEAEYYRSFCSHANNRLHFLSTVKRDDYKLK